MQDAFMILHLDDIKNAVQGACMLASGGGGSLQLAIQKIIPAFFDQTTEIGLFGIESIHDEGLWGAVVAGMGSPLKLFEDPKLVGAAVDAMKKLADLCGAFKAFGEVRFKTFQQMNFCLPVEIGAVNSIVPMIVAQDFSSTPLAVIDVDGAGRAVPTLPLTTYARQINLYPNILGGKNLIVPGSEYFDYVSTEAEDETTLEAAFLGMIDSKAFGYASGLAMYAANGPTFRGCNPVAKGVSDSLNLGDIINQKIQLGRLEGVLAYINQNMKRIARQIFYGNVTDMKQATSSLDNGYVVITGANCPYSPGDFTGQTFEIFILNENIWGQITKSGSTQPWIVGPDSMCYLTDSGDVFDNSDLWNLYEKGERPYVSIIGIQAPPEVLSNVGLMAAWVDAVKSVHHGPNSYITPWMSG